jgi:hypothetical protein
VGNVEEYFAILHCRPSIQAQSLFCAEPEMLTDAFDKLARTRRRIPKPGCVHPLPWEQMLTPAEQGRLQAHRADVQGKEWAGSFCADISKVEKVRRATEMTPTLVQNSKIWSEAHGRTALPMEHFVFQGFPALPAVAVHAKLPWASALGTPPAGVSDSELRSLTGNAMHCGVLGSIVLYALCSIEVANEQMRFRHMRSLLELPGLSDDERACSAGAGACSAGAGASSTPTPSAAAAVLEGSSTEAEG